jgi:DNA repair photolyase
MKKTPAVYITRDDKGKGRGARLNTPNPYLQNRYELPESSEGYDPEDFADESKRKTDFIEIFPKSILSKNNSPDLSFDYSINPYSGCEHGCTYCYARNSHEYWGFSAGIDFEKKILIKKNASALLEQTFGKGNWKAQPIVLSGNTDCYQPAENHFRITRSLLEVFLKFEHPVSIITKNALILRDLDLLTALNEKKLVRVTISITTLREELRRIMEPRTSAIQKRLEAVRILSEKGIAVHVNLAPIVPGLNSDEIFDLVKACAASGATSASYIVVRLNGRIGEIFEQWVKQTLPERADKIIHLIQETHGGTLRENRWGVRMKGEGVFARQIETMFRVAMKKYLPQTEVPQLDFSRFNPGGQLKLF